MAISHGSTTTAVNAGTNSLTISSHVVSGTDPALIVKVALRSTTITVTGITWNGSENLTQLNNDRNGDAHSSFWYLAGPTATTANVVITLSGSARVVGAASTYTGVHSSAPFRTAANSSANGTDAAPTTDVVANSGEMAVDCLCQVSAGPDTATGDHTERHDTAATGGGTDTRGASQEAASAGATETMGWTMSSTDNWALCAGALQEPGTGISIPV